MRTILLIFCILQSTFIFAQTTETVPHEASALPYVLPSPEGWGTERFLLPISFAPEIPYTGAEDIRFMPGWSDIKTAEYWSYVFLWYLDGKQEVTAEIIEKNLTAYYTGLFKVNTQSKDLSKKDIVKVKASIAEAPQQGHDEKTFTGTVLMQDYMKLEPLTLNFSIHLLNCSDNNQTYLFYQASPMPYTDKVWDGLNALWSGFTCESENK